MVSTPNTLLRRFGPIPPERAIYLLRQVCHSLSEAESCGLVHRDIKPANIFLCRYGEDYDFVKVLDFGLVKAFDEPSGQDTGLTRENVVQGTPAFIAPEQALGGSTLDGRVDIYATGCVAYWLLTGQLVFTAETPMGLLMHHIHTPPRPTLGSVRATDPARARPAGAVLPGEGPCGSAAVSQGAVAQAGRGGGRRRLDPGSGSGLVANAPASGWGPLDRNRG